MRAQTDRPSKVTDSELPWDMTDPAMAEVRLLRLTEELSADPGKLGDAVEATTQLARAQSLQGKLEDASRTLDQAERLLGSSKEIGPNLRLGLERGRLLVLERIPMMARQRFLEVFSAAMEAGEDYFAVDAAQMMSVVEPMKKKNEWTLRALALAEESKDERVRRWRGPLHAELGRYHAGLLKLQPAYDSFERAAECHDRDGSKKAAARARSSMGQMLRLMNRVDEALELQHQADAEFAREGITDGTVQEEIAECLYALKRADEAKKFFARAYGLLSDDEWIKNNEPARIKRMKTLGEVRNKP